MQSESPAPGLSLRAIIENLLFVADEPVSLAHLAQASEASLEQVEAAVAELYANGQGLRLQRKGDRIQLTTHPEAAPFIERFLGLELTSKLSAASLETLAIVAYQQPCTRVQVEAVRGVNCDSVLRNLLSKGLIEEVGRLETVGRPIVYGTTFEFLQHFGLSDLSELPPLPQDEAEAMQSLSQAPADDDSQVPGAAQANGQLPTALGANGQLPTAPQVNDQLPTDDAQLPTDNSSP